MVKLDEHNQILVTNPFADDSPTLSSNNHDILVNLMEDHPFCSPSVSPARRCNTSTTLSVAIVDSEGETRARLMGPQRSVRSSTMDAKEDQDTGDASPGGGDTIIPPCPFILHVTHS